MAVTIRDAISTARATIEEHFGEQIGSELLLEEFRFDERKGLWNVTFGYDRTYFVGGDDDAGELKTERVYKSVEINRADGTVGAVKIRPVAAVA